MSAPEHRQAVLELFAGSVAFVPANRALSELRLIVERIAFTPELSEFFSVKQQNPEKAREVIDLLLAPDVSPEMGEFLGKLADAGYASELSDGDSLLDDATQSLLRFREVTLSSAVRLEPEQRQRIQAMVLSRVEGEARVIFQEDPSIVAGCLIVDGERLIDLSLRTNAIGYLRTYLTDHQ